MALINVNDSFDSSVFNGASCAFGVFDGLHEGHRYLIEQACATAAQGQRSLVLTFDIDPDEVFHPERLRKLMSNDRRLNALMRTGVDDVVVLPFIPEWYSMDPLDFLEELFGENAPAYLHVGEDFRFGARAAGTVQTLDDWGIAAGCNIRAHHLLSSDGKPITATRIRLLLADGHVKDAAALLGRPYRMIGTVVKGRGEGAALGFATANMNVPDRDRVVGDGVYAAYARVCGQTCKAAVSVGVAPTFENATANIEAHLLDFDGDIVGKELGLDFVKFLRPMMKFDSADELVATVKGNIDWVRQNL